MTSTKCSRSNHLEQSEKQPTSKERRMPSWGHDPPQALVYREGQPRLGVEEINDANRESNSFEISLPRWRNRVRVHIDMGAQEGYVATLRLDRMGLKKNWQRHLGRNFKVLYVKGKKPEWPY